jgi:tetratricopeptide (TPR) repeat protein
MLRGALIVGCGALLVVSAVWLGTGGTFILGASPYHAGDSVTVIQDCDAITPSGIAEKISAGATVIVSKVSGRSLLVDAIIPGWIPAKNVIPADQAISYFSEQINRAPEDAHNYYCRAGVWQTQSKYERALQDYDQAINLDPAELAYRIERGNFFLVTKDHKRAIADFTSVLKKEPKSHAALIGRGGAHCEQGNYAKAVSDLGAVIEQIPQDITARANFAELLACCPDPAFRDGKLAVQLATELSRETGSQEPQILHYLACAYAECGDFKSAVKWEQQAIDITPTERQGYHANFQKALTQFESKKPLHEFMTFSH